MSDRLRLLLISVITAMVFTAQGHTTAIDTGQAIYQQGTLISQQAFIDHQPAPARLFACKNCHGDQAQGSTEGGRNAPRISWHHLSKHYTQAQLFNTLSSGIKPNGKPLQAMPRYDINQSETQALIAYLSQLENHYSQGLTDNHITIGVMPGANPAMNQAQWLALQAYFSTQRFYNRQIVLQWVTANPSPSQALFILINLGRQPMPPQQLSLAIFASAIENPNHFALYAPPQPHQLPPHPQLATDQAKFQYQQLALKHALPQTHLSAQFWALAAARLISQLLQDSGKSPTAEQAIEHLEKLYQFQTDYGPALTFTYNKHTGASQ